MFAQICPRRAARSFCVHFGNIRFYFFKGDVIFHFFERVRTVVFATRPRAQHALTHVTLLCLITLNSLTQTHTNTNTHTYTPPFPPQTHADIMISLHRHLGVRPFRALDVDHHQKSVCPMRGESAQAVCVRDSRLFAQHVLCSHSNKLAHHVLCVVQKPSASLSPQQTHLSLPPCCYIPSSTHP